LVTKGSAARKELAARTAMWQIPRSSLNAWDFILLCMPIISFAWGDDIKSRFLNARYRQKVSETELCRTIEALREISKVHEMEVVTLRRKLRQVEKVHEKEIVALQGKLDKVEKEQGKLERGKRKALARLVSKILRMFRSFIGDQGTFL
jgi:hypothetical protein